MSRPFHIAIDGLNLSHGGGTVVMARLADAFVDAGCTVTVLAARPHVLDTAKRDAIRVAYLPQAQGAFRSLFYRRLYLSKKLRAIDADAVLSFNYRSPVSLPQVTYHINVIPFLSWSERKAAVGALRAVMQARAARDALTGSTVNAFESRHIADLAGQAQSPVLIAYTGIDIPEGAAARPAAGAEKVVCLVTSGAAHKRNDVALRAFRAFREAEPGARLQIFGQTDAIRKGLAPELLADGDLMSSVSFGGYVDRPTLYGALSGAFALLTASELESFYMVALEAMIVGTPVVASDISSVHESCGEAGLFFPVGDWRAAADALSRLRDPGVWAARSRASNDWAKRFDADALARDFVVRVLPLLEGK